MPLAKWTFIIGLSAMALTTAASTSVQASPASPGRFGQGIDTAHIVPADFTDGSEFLWQPRQDLTDSWMLRGPENDSDDFQRIYDRATLFGDAISELKLGLKYYKGDGVAQDFAASAKWLRLSAQQGNHTAQAILGYQYYCGAGVPHDLIEAHLWVTLALATMPDGKARDSIVSLMDAIQNELTVEQRLAAEQRVRDWYAGMSPLELPLTR